MAHRDKIAEHGGDDGGPGQAGHIHPQSGHQQNVKQNVCDVCDDTPLGEQLRSPVDTESPFYAQEHFKERRGDKQGLRVVDHVIDQNRILHEQFQHRPFKDQ